MSGVHLEMRSVRKRFDALNVLADVTLSVHPGEFVSVLGPSGTGKSTILKLLTGALKPDSGEILLNGSPLSEAKSPFAFMPQRDALMPWRKIIDNATLGLEVQGVGRAKARERVAPLFAEFGLEGFEQHYPAQLSGGMRQRAALMRTIAQDKAMLLLDEPFGALDALTRTQMQHWLQSMREKHGWTVLLITHDVREAVLLSDRIYLLTGRPARMKQEIAVPLPRPRGSVPSPEASAIESEILKTLLQPKANEA